MPQIKMAQRRWKSLSQIFVGPYLISRNENQGSLNFNKQTYITTNSGLSTNIGCGVMSSSLCKKLEGAIFSFQVESLEDGVVLHLSDHRARLAGRIGENDNIPLQSFIEPE